MKKEDKRTAEEIEKRKIAYKIVESNLSHKAGTNALSIEEAVNAVVSGMEHVSLLPVQEQSKQEVTEDTIFDMAKEYINTVPGHLQNIGQAYMDGVTKGLSLPQEQKDKVTGVSDIKELLFDAWISSDADSVIQNLCGMVDKASPLIRESFEEWFSKNRQGLLSSKAVEQKEPEVKEYNKHNDFKDLKCVQIFYGKECIHPYCKCDRVKPIQEAEHKQGVKMLTYSEVEELADEHLKIASISKHEGHCEQWIEGFYNFYESLLSLPLKEEQKDKVNLKITAEIIDSKYPTTKDNSAYIIQRNELRKEGAMWLRSLLGENGKDNNL